MSTRSPLKRRWRAALYLLPLAIAFGAPALVLWLGGEFVDPGRIVELQADPSRLVLHAPAYSDSSQYVKAHTVVQRGAKILAVGNSRVLSFRHELFHPDVSFYNAGGTTNRIQDFRLLLERIPSEKRPRVLIIDTEMSFFHPLSDRQTDLDPLYVQVQRQMQTPARPEEIYRANWWKVWADTFAGKILWSRLGTDRGFHTTIGLQALCHGRGCRNDGSWLYHGPGSDISDPRNQDYQFAKTLGYIRGGVGRFAWGDTLSERALGELDRLFDFCTANGIHLIAFMPPHAHAVWAAMQSLGDKYAYVRKLPPVLGERFLARGFEFYDFSDFAMLGAPDTEALDGFHGSERTYLRIVIRMLESGSQLNSAADLPRLRQLLTKAPPTAELTFDN